MDGIDVYRHLEALRNVYIMYLMSKMQCAVGKNSNDGSLAFIVLVISALKGQAESTIEKARATLSYPSSLPSLVTSLYLSVLLVVQIR